MALYRFKVTFEDYDEVSRDIDIKSNQTFLDLHKAIHQSTGYNPEFPSSFYISNDQDRPWCVINGESKAKQLY
jgi:hypothetical protein